MSQRLVIPKHIIEFFQKRSNATTFDSIYFPHVIKLILLLTNLN